MIWNIKNTYHWHRWFAWYPVTLNPGNRRAWLRIVSRRRITGPVWEYME